MGPRFEEAFRAHLRRLAANGTLAPDIVRIGPFWSEHPAVEIDAVALAGRGEEAVLLGEAKWARSTDAAAPCASCNARQRRSRESPPHRATRSARASA